MDGPFGIAFFDTLAATLDPPADLSVRVDQRPDPAVPGETVTFTVTVTNHGPADAADTGVTFTLPTGATLVSATSGQGTCESTGGAVECEMTPLTIGGLGTVEIELTAPGRSRELPGDGRHR